VRAAIVSAPGNAAPNEDWAGVAPGLAVVLDGVSPPVGIPTGCNHNVPWYVQQLGRRLLSLAGDRGLSLVDVLATAISQVGELHSGCDLSAPSAPAAAVGLLRLTDSVAEYLLLGDVVILLDQRAHEPTMITDHRVDAAEQAAGRAAVFRQPIGSTAHQRELARFSMAQLELRDRPGGYWVASGNPAVTQQALTGSLPHARLHAAALLTDGASALVDRYRLATWQDVLKLIESDPGELVRQVRTAEATDPRGQRWGRYKPSDDATAIYLADD
jgi:hypothetical protein